MTGSAERDSAPILIITGAPATGKSTTAGLLAARSARSVHLEADAFFRFVHSGYVEPWKPESHEQNTTVMSVVARAAAGYAAAGYETIVDGIVIPGVFLEPVCDVLHDAGCEAAFVVLRASPSVCAERTRSREGGELADQTVIEQLWRSFADLGDFERNAVDLDGEGPDEVADIVAGRWAEGLLAI